ncbi:MAG: acetyl-CoA carboxylase carboxyl transferase subunit beta [Butyrivibrio sp.]|nr:acetyl-CoA carboxylase carboxyl transferase subunit beta [Butyrivibrio sp.]
MNTYERLNSITDKDSFAAYEDDIDTGRVVVDDEYRAKIERHRKRYELYEAVLTGRAAIGGHNVAIGIMDARFLRASMGYYVGEKITRLFEHATKEKLPVVLFCASGGARVQEGIASLLQMQKTSQACVRHGQEGLLYISVLTNPTFGGVTASFATLADIIIAEEGALIGFAGKRVIEQTTGETLPEGFQTARFHKEHGFVDEVVSNLRMRDYLTNLLDVFGKAGRRNIAQKPLTGAGYHLTDPSEDPEAYAFSEAWKNVKLARKITRPTALEYMCKLFTDFTQLHGDRVSGDDPAVVGGIGFFKGRPVISIGQQKGKQDIQEAIRRNWGMASPSGHHKAIRLMKLAEKFGIPVVLFVDTMGAACGRGAEEMGQADIIAKMLGCASELKTLTLSIIVGEAGSGGALAFAIANEVWMLEHSVYSVITPEGYASIVWKDSEKKKEAADAMGMCASSLYEKKVIDRIIPEPEPVTADNLDEICKQMSAELEDFFARYDSMTGEEIAECRYERYRRF